jgi:Ketopantoate reductase PanE/ApbA
MPMLGAHTAILTLQNGWGNADRIAAVAGKERVMVGLTYHSGTLVAPGRVKHSGIGMTYVGEIDGAQSLRLEAAVAAFCNAAIETTLSPRILDEIWKKLALNVCTLPISALLRFPAQSNATRNNRPHSRIPGQKELLGRRLKCPTPSTRSLRLWIGIEVPATFFGRHQYRGFRSS